MITTGTFVTNENRMELISSEPGAFPCICNRVDFSNYVGNCAGWHWHQRFEINYVIEGRTIEKIGNETYQVNPGEAMFINTNVLHQCESSDVKNPPKLYTVFFDTEFLTGGFNTVYSQKYVMPVSTSMGLPALHIKSDSSEGIRMLSCLMDMIELFDGEPFGFEFKIRSCLSDFWLYIFDATRSVRENSTNVNRVDDSKIRNMMEYIEKNYPEKIMVEDIAGAAGISARECTRCFSKIIGQPPIGYLNHYRIRQAAGMLVESDMTIGAIAEKCGFISDSYFGKMFRETMGCTPRHYRKEYNR